MNIEKMERIHFLAAEVYKYSYPHYEDRLANPRFSRYMPDDVRNLEKALKEKWPLKKVMRKLEANEEQARHLLKAMREALELVDAENAAASFRVGVRQSIEYALEQGLESEKDIKGLTEQICYRVADFDVLLRHEGRKLEAYSAALRHESSDDEDGDDEVPLPDETDTPDEDQPALKVDRVLAIEALQAPFDQKYFLDLTSGEIIFTSDYADMDEEIEDLDDPRRFFAIPKMASHEAFRIMEDFVENKAPDTLRASLRKALRGSKPFRRFKDVLHRSEQALNLWYAYENERLTWIAAEMFKEYRIEVVWSDQGGDVVPFKPK